MILNKVEFLNVGEHLYNSVAFLRDADSKINKIYLSIHSLISILALINGV